jgi:hypothetical protein
MMSWQQRLFLSVVILLSVGLLLVLASSTGIQAQGPTLPTPTNVPGDGGNGSGGGKDGSRGTPPVAYIELNVLSAPTGAWSVVQWQDSAGNWHDVEGWRSSLPENGIQRWVVEAKDFNTGPFRWVVRQGQLGSTAGMSNPFNLPAGANETVRVAVTLQ